MRACQWSLGFLIAMLRLLSRRGQIQAAVSWLLILLSPSVVAAQPRVAQQPIQKDSEQCSKAETPAQCQGALPACERVLAIWAQAPAAPYSDAANSVVLNKTAWCERELGRYALAESHWRNALALLRRIHGPQHPTVATILNDLGDVLASQGKYDAAEPLHRQALAMRQKLLGAEHPDIARSLHSLAEVHYGQGKYEAAEARHRQALAMRQRQLGTEHPDVALSINSLAAILETQGKYEAAEMLYRQALAMSQKLLGAQHPTVALSLYNLAGALYSRGKCEAAEIPSRQALEMRLKVLGAEHPNVADSLNNLAAMLMCQEKYSAAEPLYRQALEMRQKLLGTEHPEVATSINNLAFVLYCQEKYELAERLFTRALLMSQKLLGIEHPDVAGGLNNLALSLDAQGNYEAAEIRYRQALAMRQKLLGAAHPDVATTLNNLALLLIRRGQFTTALPLLAQAAQIEEQVLRATSSETRMNSALRLFRDTEDTIYGLLLEHADNEALKRLVMTTALLRKGRAAEAGTLANRLLHQSRGNPLTKQRFEQWQRLRQQRESLLYGNGDGLSPVALQKQLRSLSQQADDQESQLAAAMPKWQQFQPPAFDDILPAVARRLPKGGRLFEVVWAKPFNYKSRGIEDRWRAPHYVALEITADQQLAVHDLGVAATLDRQVQVVLDALRNPSSDPKDKAKALYDQILKPLLSASMKHVYLSLDGSLNLVPFDALHDGTDYLLGRRTFHYLTSGRDLLRTNAAAAKQAALLIADPDFGQTRPKDANSRIETFYQRLSSLNRLAGAQQEAKRIGDLLHVAPFVGSGASESIVRAVQSPWIVHIASHGLFLNSQDVARAASRGHDPFGARKLVPLGDSGPASLRMTGDVDSLSRSALVLAGATRGAQAKDAAHDGLLTAEEARSLNLFGTQLVVLSACETGQGELSVGQGVYGLRRAFLVAGAETLVTSLWQVNDIATGRLMELYYQQLLKKRKGRLEGMQEAMKEMRAKYPHPYYWAPFLVIGNDGPLRPPGARPKGP